MGLFQKLQTLLSDDDCEALSGKLLDSASDLEPVIEQACEKIERHRAERRKLLDRIQQLENECASQTHANTCNEKVIERLSDALHKTKASKAKLEACLKNQPHC